MGKFARKTANGARKPKRGASLPTEKEIAKEKHKKLILEIGSHGLPVPIKRGRPTNYNPKLHPEKLVKLMSAGISKTTACVYLGITREEMVLWPKAHKEFADALKYGEMLSQAWWEEMGRLNLSNRDFNSTLWMMQMTNFGWSRNADGKAIGQSEEETLFNDAIEAEIIEDDSRKTAKVLKILSESGVFESEFGEASSTSIN